MTVTITPVNHGTVAGDKTGDIAFDAFEDLNANEQNIKSAIEDLQGRMWTVDNTARTLALGERVVVSNHAGITNTLVASFTTSATSYSDIHLWNADSNSDVTLDPDGTDEIFLTGIGQGAGVSIALSPGQIAICTPRVTNVSWDVIVITDWSSGQATAPFTTTGDLTCGALTSTGFDDITTGKRLELADIVMKLGVTGTSDFTIGRVATVGLITITGGITADNGSVVRLYGSSHSSKGGDIEFNVDAAAKLNYDHSAESGAGLWNFFKNINMAANTIKWGMASFDLPFFDFIGTADADTTSAISTHTTSGAIQGHIQIDINGTKRWLAFLADPS